jgi:outer membrane protein assembly factor BamD (BamD/ComL family)
MSVKFMITFFKQANQHLREGNFATAIDLYKLALQNMPDLAVVIQFNLELAQRRLIQNAAENTSLS